MAGEEELGESEAVENLCCLVKKEKQDGGK